MTAPFKKAFTLPDGRGITSMVIDQAEFDELCDQLYGVIVVNAGERADPSLVDKIRNAKHLPMMARGTKTAKFFEQWDVQTDLLCVIVRGHGPELAKQLFNQ